MGTTNAAKTKKCLLAGIALAPVVCTSFPPRWLVVASRALHFPSVGAAAWQRRLLLGPSTFHVLLLVVGRWPRLLGMLGRGRSSGYIDHPKKPPAAATAYVQCKFAPLVVPVFFGAGTAGERPCKCLLLLGVAQQPSSWAVCTSGQDTSMYCSMRCSPFCSADNIVCNYCPTHQLKTAQ